MYIYIYISYIYISYIYIYHIYIYIIYHIYISYVYIYISYIYHIYIICIYIYISYIYRERENALYFMCYIYIYVLVIAIISKEKNEQLYTHAYDFVQDTGSTQVIHFLLPIPRCQCGSEWSAHHQGFQGAALVACCSPVARWFLLVNVNRNMFLNGI